MMKGTSNIFDNVNLCFFCYQFSFKALFSNNFSEEKKAQLFNGFRDQLLKYLTLDTLLVLDEEDMIKAITLIWELIMPTNSFQ
jgi:hypothetical protein